MAHAPPRPRACMAADPALVLWADASLNAITGRGGIAVVTAAGEVRLSLRVEPPVASSFALERQGVLEAIRIADRLVADGVRPVEIRTDCRHASKGVELRKHLLPWVRIRWSHRSGNRAHHAARRAAGIGG